MENSERDEMPDHLSNCIQVKKQQLELDMKQQIGSKLGKAVYCHPAYLTYMQSNSSTLAWKIPCTEEPSRLQSMGPLRVEYN